MSLLNKKKQESSDIADLTPMLDCVFLLLLFFIVASSFSEGTDLFRVNLPTASHASTVSLDQVIELAIDSQGRFFIQDDFVPDENLYSRIEDIMNQTQKNTLVIHGDRNGPYEKAVLAMDVAQALKISEISMAVKNE